MKKSSLLFLLILAPIFLMSQVKVLAPNGNVVMGSTEANPTASEKLDIRGSILVKDHFKSIGPYGKQLIMTIDGLGDFVMNRDALDNFGGKASGSIFCVGANRIFDVRNSANQYMFRVREADGYVGIGTNNPMQKLHLASGNAAKPGGGMWIATSDKRSKKEIAPFTKGLETLSLINPVSYQYNGRFGTNADDQTHIGLIAQDVAKYAPEMVIENTYKEIASSYKDETGTVEEVLSEESFLSVDPSELTYILINSVKEQQSLIEKQQASIEALQVEVERLKNQNQADKGIGLNLFESEKAFVKQNVPNPFSKSTRIEYFLPENSQTASIKVFDLTGKELKSVDLTNKGNSQIELDMENLVNGLYLYSLVVDGKIIDSKQIVLE